MALSRRTWLLAVVAVAARTGAARAADAVRCAPDDAHRTRGRTAACSRLKTVVLPTGAATPYYYALQTGLFAKAGLDVDFVPSTSGNLAIQTVVAGAADVALTNTLSLAEAYAHGIPLQVLFGAGQHTPDSPIMWLFVAAGGPIHNAQDLEGRIVAVNGLHDLGTLAVRAWLARSGVDSTNVRFIELSSEAMLPALQQGRVDAITSFEPFTTAVVESDTARSIATPFDAIAPAFGITVWFATAPWVDANRDAAERFVRVMRAATTYTNAHLSDVVPIVAAYTKMTPETVRRGLRAKTALDVGPGQLQPVIDVAARFGELAAVFPARAILPDPPLSR